MITVNPQAGVSDDFAPSGQDVPEDLASSIGIVEISTRIRNGNLDFTIRDVEGNFVRFDNGERYLAITGNTRLILRLSDVINWSFDTAAGPFKLKKESAAPFYKVSFDQDDSSPREIVLDLLVSSLQFLERGL